MDNLETVSLKDLVDNTETLDLKTVATAAVVIVVGVVVARKALAWKRSRTVAVQITPGSQETI